MKREVNMISSEYYNLLQSIEYCCQMLNTIDDMELTGSAEENYGVDSKADHTRYLNQLYTLYDVAKDAGVIDSILTDMKADNVDDYYFADICDEQSYIDEANAHEDLVYSARVGDKVRMSNGGIYYIADIDGNTIWITRQKDSGIGLGWSANLSDINEILERGDVF